MATHGLTMPSSPLPDSVCAQLSFNVTTVWIYHLQPRCSVRFGERNVMSVSWPILAEVWAAWWGEGGQVLLLVLGTGMGPTLIAHGLHAALTERFREVWKDPTTGQAAALLCSAFLEAGKWVYFILALLAQCRIIPANTPLMTYQTSNKMWLSGPRWRHGALLLSCKPSVKVA